jgi:CDP-glucose 4,6-dehydratase
MSWQVEHKSSGAECVIDKSFWKRKKVFLTGHTGFKGSWLCLWLYKLGAEVTGYALNPPTSPSLFELSRIDRLVTSVIADVRDRQTLSRTLILAEPDIVIHMAAQPIVRDSYKVPVETYDINVMGTVNVLEAVRSCKTVKAFINITTDKCYENKEWIWGYRENEPLGGYDPYSSSKACSELVTVAYRSSFFNPEEYGIHGVAVATARAGNVIGGGDWASDRLIPDCVRALLNGEKIKIRNPKAVRPWQHVLDPLNGYLILAQKLVAEGPYYSGAWNFAPDDSDAVPVESIVKRLYAQWGKRASYTISKGKQPHEAHYLRLDCSKAKAELGWRPRWKLDKTIDSIVEWTRAYQQGRDARKTCFKQLDEYSRGSVEARN